MLTAKWLTGQNPLEMGLMSKKMTISERYGVLLWYLNRYGDIEDISFNSFVDCCLEWPARLKQDLDMLAEKRMLFELKTGERSSSRKRSAAY
ncbi:hypothetical protein JCM19239_2678 [Vibrio variabilis]|uniref:DUF2087 domain-containing protein n=1 Tax=Vibrio variabilis TaxID=990271 RepID=A0ABQ0JNJ0_9VIBR|nr:hypothetical protein JCM19239_2678 [Vibrio variabilis]